MKVIEAIKLIQKDGWFKVRQKGSHRQFKHATKKGLVTVSGKDSEDLPIGTEKSIFRQAGIKA